MDSTSNKYITVVYVRADQTKKVRTVLTQEGLGYVIDADRPREVFESLYPNRVPEDRPRRERMVVTRGEIETVPLWRRRELEAASPIRAR